MPPERAPSNTRVCPICGKPAKPDAQPFCSERCRAVDLNRWLSGGYSIAGQPADDVDD